MKGLPHDLKNTTHSSSSLLDACQASLTQIFNQQRNFQVHHDFNDVRTNKKTTIDAGIPTWRSVGNVTYFYCSLDYTCLLVLVKRLWCYERRVSPCTGRKAWHSKPLWYPCISPGPLNERRVCPCTGREALNSEPL